MKILDVDFKDPIDSCFESLKALHQIILNMACALHYIDFKDKDALHNITPTMVKCLGTVIRC